MQSLTKPELLAGLGTAVPFEQPVWYTVGVGVGVGVGVAVGVGVGVGVGRACHVTVTALETAVAPDAACVTSTR